MEKFILKKNGHNFLSFIAAIKKIEPSYSK